MLLSNNASFFNILPDEIISHILIQLPINSILNAFLINKTWCKFINDDHLWKKILIRDYSDRWKILGIKGINKVKLKEVIILNGNNDIMMKSVVKLIYRKYYLSNTDLQYKKRKLLLYLFQRDDLHKLYEYYENAMVEAMIIYLHKPLLFYERINILFGKYLSTPEFLMDTSARTLLKFLNNYKDSLKQSYHEHDEMLNYIFYFMDKIIEKVNKVQHINDDFVTEIGEISRDCLFTIIMCFIEGKKKSHLSYKNYPCKKIFPSENVHRIFKKLSKKHKGIEKNVPKYLGIIERH